MREVHAIVRPLASSTPAPAAVIAAVALVTIAIAGCVTPVDQYNQPGRITSVGPVEFDGSSVLINYTLVDDEGDDQTIQVGICEDGEGEDADCPTPVVGVGGDGRTSLPTTPAGEDIGHVLAWNVGCGRVGDDQCLETDRETTYVAYLSVEGSDKTVSTAPFSLADLGADQVPECDTSVQAISDSCNPDDESTP